MMSMDHERIFDPTERMLRQFGALSIVFFGALAARAYLHHRPLLAAVMGALGLAIGVSGLVRPRSIRPVFIGWMKVAFPIGWVVSRIVLAAIFYAIITPIALVLRITGRDVLGLKRGTGRTTYWQPKAIVNDKSRYLRQF
jgi:hypothetical protein